MTKDGAFRLNKAYGWKPCMALAKQDQPYPTSPARNSDSFALFASGKAPTHGIHQTSAS